MTTIEEVLSCRRLAVVGVSRNPRHFSRAVFHELLARGYDAVPVNPSGDPIEGRAAARSLREMTPPPEAAILLTRPDLTAQAVADGLATGVRRFWFHQGVGPGSLTPEARKLCVDAGATAVTGECLFMHLPRSGFIHRLHGFFRHLHPAA